MLDYRDEMLCLIQDEFENELFKERCRDGCSSSFTRSRVFTLKKLVVFLMMLRTSYQREINNFCKLLIKGDYNIRQATAGALTQARAKLNPYAFQRLQEIATTTFYRRADYNKWHNYRLLAVDGSVVNLPYSASIIDEFGCEEYIKKSSGKKSIARCSLLYDVLNQVPLDAQISGYKTSEKKLLSNHLDKIEEGDLVLADRGYAYSSVIYWLSERKAEFCIRFHDHKLKSVKAFINSEQSETQIELPLDPNFIKSMSLPKDTSPIKVRLVKVELDTGDVEIIGTSLLDREEYKIEEFKKLYHLRWGVEEAFKMLKSRIDLEFFSGRTARSIYQDFYAKILMMTLCATLSHPIDKKVREEYKAAKTGNKHDQQINRADAIAETRGNLIALFIEKKHQQTIAIMDNIIEASRLIIRPKRKSKRLKTVKKRKPLNYKPL